MSGNNNNNNNNSMSISDLTPLVAAALRDRVMADLHAENTRLHAENTRLNEENTRVYNMIRDALAQDAAT